MQLTLAKKVFLLILISFSTQSVLLYFFIEDMIKTVLLDESRKQAQVFLDGLEREITASESSESHVFLQEKIDKAVEKFTESNFSIYRLYIFNKNGGILADSLKEKQKKKEIKPYMLPVFLTGERLISKEIEYKKNISDKNSPKELIAITDIVIPAYKYNQIVFAIEIEINLKNTMERVSFLVNKYEKNIYKLILVSSILFTLLFWFLLKKNILTPIQEINRIAKNITDGKLGNRIHLHGSDEVFHLGQSINTMAISIEELLEKQEMAYFQVLQSLSKALEAKDPYTARHSDRVAKISVELGKYIGLAEKDWAVLSEGALMHDIGKIAIPDHILNKPGKLTDEEFAIMRSHPKKTAEIMRPLRHYAQHREIAAWHHEQWNGKGYPDGLKGEDIPVLARIVSIADTWDAMTGDRVYRKGMSEEKALTIITAERDLGQWDPCLISVFIEMMKEKMR
ncbi:HD domain-containing phosphohydrolase [Candidatus Electronema sp. PJ]|uniref:HD domain-containing phosphohydrolase n=1 Tax=Candidatus Electronema sp. PJ TaxID=3401572 RepID=UPI003AA95E76